MGLTTKVELRLQAKNLINRDSTSKSDPFCVIHRKQPRTHEFVEIGRTEHINDNLNPKWEMKFTLDYQFEERQELKFTVYDWDGEKKDLASHDYLGSALVSLGEIVSAQYSKFEIPLELPKKLTTKTTNSTLVVYSEELGTSQDTFQLTVNGRGLDKKDFLGKSDPFLIVSKQTDDNEWTQVFLTEVIKKTLDPDWRAITGQVTALTGKNPTRKLLFQVYDHDKDEKHDLIGQFETSLQELKARTKHGTTGFPLINPKKKEKKKGYENSGVLNIVSFKVDERNFTFVDYLQSGVQLHFTVAIDFTASNKKPSDPNSLHCILPNQDNQYTLAIKSVGNIIQDYDTDRQFPALGFGAKIPPSTEVTHEFFLNFNPQNPFCSGVQGILEAYQNALKTVRLSGPTYFAPVINHCAKFASTYKDGSNYFVLLIITDGMICDLEATKEAIIAASSLPLSLIIVGVGEEDFSSMEFLDADKRVLKSSATGTVAARDIVQFVALRDFLGKQGENYEATKEDLAKAVLAEIPKQFMEFMSTKQITPL